MSKGTALVKNRDRYEKLKLSFPDRIEFYDEKIEGLNEEINVLKVCRRCGRPLKDEEAQKRGYGKECFSKNGG